MELRKITYRMYPGTSQSEKLDELLGLHQRLYNTALEERILAYKDAGQSLGFAAQCKELTAWRKASEALATVNAQSLQVTLKRLDLAYAAFFRRVKAGQNPGFPRFKSVDRFSGWGYKTHGDGWRLHAGDKMKHGHVRLSGVGMVKLRGQARAPGEVKIAEVQHKSGKWYLSVTVECDPQRTGGTDAMGMDFLHKTSAILVKKYGLIATEQLNVKNMTAHGGQHKKGLNRSILDTAPSTFLNLLKTKAEEAGSLWVEVPTRQVKPSQTCHRCGIQWKKPLSERKHICTCGANCSRDENAARVMLNWALYGNAARQELSEVGSRCGLPVLNHETSPVTASAAQVE